MKKELKIKILANNNSIKEIFKNLKKSLDIASTKCQEASKESSSIKRQVPSSITCDIDRTIAAIELYGNHDMLNNILINDDRNNREKMNINIDNMRQYLDIIYQNIVDMNLMMHKYNETEGAVREDD